MKQKKHQESNNESQVNELELTFDFIKNEILKENLAIYLQYIIFLLRHEEINGPILYSVNKNIILYIASIIEGVLFYTLHTLFEMKIFERNKILKSEFTPTDIKKIYVLDDGNFVGGAIFKNKINDLSSTTKFIELNRACKRAGIIDEKLFEEIEQVREYRNKIHLFSLKNVDNYYNSQDIEISFKAMKDTIETIKNYLLKIENSKIK